MLHGSTPAVLADLRAERSCGLFFGSPARRCVAHGSGLAVKVLTGSVRRMRMEQPGGMLWPGWQKQDGDLGTHNAQGGVLEEKRDQLG